MKNLNLLISIVFCLLHQSISAEDVIGCGGFIKSNTEINFKIIKVKLLTKDGAVKYTTEASPVNGYFMIPVYTKGEYILQVNPPPGWSFEPSQVAVNIDGQTDACSRNEDINFFFKGFGLSGKVVSQGDPKNRGPSGVKLSLLQNGKQLDSTISGNDGSYYFSNVMPGVYEIEALNPTIKFLANKVQVELSKENWSAKDNLVIGGYKIQGSVQTGDKTGVQNALVQLHFLDDQTNVDTKSFECDQSSKKGSFICSVRTDSNGKFTFSNVVFGRYKLTSRLALDSLEFDTKPEYLTADLTRHTDLELNENFVLNSVTINSNVLLSKDKQLSTAEVFVNNKKYQLDKNGGFTLDKLESGSYRVSIKAKNVYYEERVVQVDLASGKCLDKSSDKHKNLLSLTQFMPKSFDVCGHVRVLKNSDLLKNVAQSIQIKCYLNNKLVKSVNLDKDMKYCTVLDTGLSYVLKAELSENLAQVLRLVPGERKVSLTDSAVFDANFEQLEAKLEGKVEFLANQAAPSDLSISLKSTDSSWRQDVPVKCSQEQKENQSYHTCSFSLNNLLFGNYEITTNYDDLYCWKKHNDQKVLAINVNSELQNTVIQQLGYKLNYKLTHRNALFKIVDQANNVLFNRNVLSDSDLSGEVCLPKISAYTAVIDSCHRFSDSKSDQDLVQIRTDLFKKGANSLVLKALKHQATVEIAYKFDNEKDKSVVGQDDFKVLVKSGEKLVETIGVSVKSEESDRTVYVGKTWLESDQSYVLTAASEKVLYESNHKQLTVNEHKCDSNHVKFEAILGIFITGSIEPKDLDSVDLTLKTSSDNAVIQQSVINSAQGFKLGPLRAPYSLYTVELSKSGYLFNNVLSETKEGNYNLKYQAQKLGQLKVNVVDAKLKSNLESVLLSLSSENRQFRQTIRTDSNGLVSFDNLKPGLYYLLVMMQEYEFTPNSHPVQITDGFHANLLVEATRVAYSVFGKVTSINGQAEGDVTVEARGLRSVGDESDLENENCRSSRENSQVENLYGTYRIRNLRPNCEYELSVQSGAKGDRVFKIMPEKYLLSVNNSDILDTNFVLVDQLDKLDVSVGVNYKLNEQLSLKSRQLNSFVRVKLFKTNQPDQIIQTVYSPVNSVIYLSPLARDKNQYAVLVELLLPSTVSIFGTLNHQQLNQLQQQPVVDKLELSFNADRSHRHLNFEFKENKKLQGSDYFDLKQQQYQNVYFTLPLFVILVALVLNSKKAQLYLSNLSSQIRQKGGFVNFFKSNLQKINSDQSGAQSGKVNKSSKNSKKPKDQGSDNETLQRRQKNVQAQVNEGSSDQSEGENIGYTTEEGDMLVLHPAKPRVKKAP